MLIALASSYPVDACELTFLGFDSLMLVPTIVNFLSLLKAITLSVFAHIQSTVLSFKACVLGASTIWFNELWFMSIVL